MNSEILNFEFQDYLQSIEKEDFKAISLRKSPFPLITSAEIAQQVKGKQVAKKKFPSLHQTPKIYYPPSVNLEQASSEATANYKASVVNGKTIIDLTAGFGIDCLAFAQHFESVIHIERNTELSEIVQSNVNVLGLNIECFNGTFQSYLEENPTKKFDCIYLDPARRDTSGRKFILEDLEPNIFEYLSDFWQRTDQILLKLSPLLDITSTLFQLEHTKEIHVVAVKNEVKELLVLLDKYHQGHNPKITCVNLNTLQEKVEHFYEDEINSSVQFHDVKKYIYEPNASLLKAGAFKYITQLFPVDKLHQNTHLYTSYALLDNFPGKRFEILKTIENPKKEILGMKANVIVKNFNQNIDILKKKYKIRDGGDQTLLFCQTISGYKIFLLQRIKQNSL